MAGAAEELGGEVTSSGGIESRGDGEEEFRGGVFRDFGHGLGIPQEGEAQVCSLDLRVERVPACGEVLQPGFGGVFEVLGKGLRLCEAGQIVEFPAEAGGLFVVSDFGIEAGGGGQIPGLLEPTGRLGRIAAVGEFDGGAFEVARFSPGPSRLFEAVQAGVDFGELLPLLGLLERGNGLFGGLGGLDPINEGGVFHGVRVFFRDNFRGAFSEMPAAPGVLDAQVDFVENKKQGDGESELPGELLPGGLFLKLEGVFDPSEGDAEQPVPVQVAKIDYEVHAFRFSGGDSTQVRGIVAKALSQPQTASSRIELRGFRGWRGQGQRCGPNRGRPPPCFAPRTSGRRGRSDWRAPRRHGAGHRRCRWRR